MAYLKETEVAEAQEQTEVEVAARQPKEVDGEDEMADEIKRIAVVKDVNLTKVREQIKNLEQLIETADEKSDELSDRLTKGRAYLKDVEEATPVTDMEKGKAVKGEPRRPLKDAI